MKVKKNKAIKYRIYPNSEQKEFIEEQFRIAKTTYNVHLAFYKDNAKDRRELREHCNCSVTKKNGKNVYTPAEEYKEEYEAGIEEINSRKLHRNDIYEKFPFLRNGDSTSLSNVSQHILKAFKNYSEGRAEEPTFKGRNSRNTYTITRIVSKQTDPKDNSKGNLRITDEGIFIPKLKTPIKTIYHRKPFSDSRLLSASISRDGTEYYASLAFEYYEEEPEKREVKELNVLAFNYDDLYFDSNGEVGGMPRYYKEGMKRLTIEQRKLSRMKGPNYKKIGENNGRIREIDTLLLAKPDNEELLAEKEKLLSANERLLPSKNWLKQKEKVAKIHRHIKRQREYFLHCKSKELCNQYENIVIENTSIKEAASRANYEKQLITAKITDGKEISVYKKAYKKNRKPKGDEVLDNGYFKFMNMLSYKQSDRGHILMRADIPKDIMFTCHECGEEFPYYEEKYTYKEDKKKGTEKKEQHKIYNLKCPKCKKIIDRTKFIIENLNLES